MFSIQGLYLRVSMLTGNVLKYFLKNWGGDEMTVLMTNLLFAQKFRSLANRFMLLRTKSGWLTGMILSSRGNRQQVF